MVLFSALSGYSEGFSCFVFNPTVGNIYVEKIFLYLVSVLTSVAFQPKLTTCPSAFACAFPVCSHLLSQPPFHPEVAGVPQECIHAPHVSMLNKEQVDKQSCSRSSISQKSESLGYENWKMLQHSQTRTLTGYAQKHSVLLGLILQGSTFSNSASSHLVVVYLF